MPVMVIITSGKDNVFSLKLVLWITTLWEYVKKEISFGFISKVITCYKTHMRPTVPKLFEEILLTLFFFWFRNPILTPLSLKFKALTLFSLTNHRIMYKNNQ